MALKVMKGGMFTTIQDLGRVGGQSFGIPAGGAMDRFAAQLANIILHNDPQEAVIEMTMIGATFLCEQHAVISIFGAEMGACLNGNALKHGKPIQMYKGDQLTFGAAKQGVRCYIAVKGGFAIPTMFNSRSTYVQAKIGGNNGQALVPGDRLPIHCSTTIAPAPWKTSFQIEKYFRDNSKPIRFITGRQADWFSNDARQSFCQEKYTIDPASNRMGYRLSGWPIPFQHNRQLITEGTAFGSIQIPPNGQPIILMADRQPTGGYPKIGEVIQHDLNRLSQMRPGDQVQFQEISLEEAQNILLADHRLLLKVKTACALKWRDLANETN
ncbi:biotin-dependent carboxyltransferase family protein [Bacillus sp. FJAT-50079]|uniref:5-oxoprolinase subunit C family protein n=1 Tax=Bacillus sp. FJAT-50079 TaxID=2833577 RepID=UPI001BC96E50|nr:biotin-dependent carboxyltransferase family protein [Bacillus sp. FJAT-50079]MBS4210250.1 biotin-dependent carboxyltransferase family protein [Bacillus sp. FJAT-50079]